MYVTKLAFLFDYLIMRTLMHLYFIISETETYMSSIKNASDASLDDDSDETQSEIREVDADPQDKALRRMVMEVIFGSNAASQPDPLVAVNGFDGGDISREGSQSPDSHRCASVQLYNSDHESRSSSPRSKSAASIPIEGERKIRPVRNRVKVKREDFIYDLSDNALNSKREFKKAKPQIDELSKHGIKCVPKLMLVRTNISEISGNQSVSWKSSYSSGSNIKVSDSRVSQNAVSYNISTRKSPRVFDTKPLKPSVTTDDNSKLQ